MQRRGGHRQHVKRRSTVKVKIRKAPAANSSIDPRKKLLERLACERDECPCRGKSQPCISRCARRKAGFQYQTGEVI